eukprot:COSAG06_NODE_5273_length_3593_cov_201.803663_2_plen_89_part_00
MREGRRETARICRRKRRSPCSQGPAPPGETLAGGSAAPVACASASCFANAARTCCEADDTDACAAALGKKLHCRAPLLLLLILSTRDR